MEPPWFFPAISSVKANYPLSDYAGVLNAMNAPRYLVSAYDLAVGPSQTRNAHIDAVREAGRRGCTVLLDSGNYEAYWNADTAWSPGRFHTTALEANCALTFSFDNLSPKPES